MFICYFICLVLCSLADLSSLYRLCNFEWKAAHEVEVHEETSVNYYDVGPSNLTSLGEITERITAVRIPDTCNQASNQTDNRWMIPKNSRQKLRILEHVVHLNHASITDCFRQIKNVYTHNREK